MHAFTKTLQMLLLLQSNRSSNRGDALMSSRSPFRLRPNRGAAPSVHFRLKLKPFHLTVRLWTFIGALEPNAWALPCLSGKEFYACGLKSSLNFPDRIPQSPESAFQVQPSNCGYPHGSRLRLELIPP